MRTSLKHNQLFFVLGMPRAGTTIIANFFNALNDGFCLGEPHWYCVSHNMQLSSIRDTCGKVGRHFRPGALATYRDIVPAFVKPLLSNSPYHLGGYKETYRPMDPLSEELIEMHVPEVDFFVIIFRDPIQIVSSILTRNWSVEWHDPDVYTSSFERLDDLARLDKAVVLTYENFCQDPVGYTNRILAGRFHIEGGLRLRPTGHAFGDPRANRSRRIKPIPRYDILPQELVARYKQSSAYRIFLKHSASLPASNAEAALSSPPSARQ